MLWMQACTPNLPKMTPQPAGIHNSTVPPGTVLQVFRTDGSRFIYRIDDIKNLEMTTCTIGNEEFRGPRIYKILQSAGIEDFEMITLSGKSGDIVLRKNTLQADTILAIDNRYHFQFASPAVPQDQWIDEITVMAAE